MTHDQDIASQSLSPRAVASHSLIASPIIDPIIRELEVEHVDEEHHWFLSSVPFQSGVTMLILVNAALMGVETDYPEWHLTWLIVDNFFTAVFLLEMVLKLVFLGRRYPTSGNLFDAVLVMCAIADTWVTPAVGLDVDTQSFSILRILRLFRLARILRLIKMFRPLVLIASAMTDSICSAIWVGSLVFIIIYVFAIFTTTYIGQADPNLYPGYTSIPEEIEQSEFLQSFNPHLSFGSLGKSMLTLLNITMLTEWSEIVRPLVARQPYIAALLVGFALLVIYGVLNIIVGIIADTVNQRRTELDKAQGEEERANRLRQFRQIQEIVLSMDVQGRGFLTVEQLEDAMDLPAMKALVKEANLPIAMTAADVMALVDENGDGQLQLDEMVRGMCRLCEGDAFQQTCLAQMRANKVLEAIVEQKKEIESMRQMLERLEMNVQKNLPLGLQATRLRDPGCAQGQGELDSQTYDIHRSRRAPPQELLAKSIPPIQVANFRGASDHDTKAVDNVLERSVAEALEKVRDLDKQNSLALASLCTSVIVDNLPACIEKFQREVEDRVHGIVACASESSGHQPLAETVMLVEQHNPSEQHPLPSEVAEEHTAPDAFECCEELLCAHKDATLSDDAQQYRVAV